MNKSELIDAVSKTTALARRDAENAVNAVVHTVISELKAGRKVAVVGFGAFNPSRRAARTGRNPQTGAPVRIAASKGVRFAPSAAVKDILNGRSALAAPKITSSASGASKTTAKKAAAKKTAAKKAGGRKTAAKKTAARKTAAKKTAARKTAAKKAPARKAAKRR